MKQNNIEQILKENQVIPVVTFNNVKEVDHVIDKILSKNIKCIEVTLRTDAAIDCIKYIKQKYSSKIKVGMGTVINSEQISNAINLKVDFMVSPGISRTLVNAFEKSNIAYIPGVSTPSEIIKAINLGLNTLKFFPANLFGGIDALKTYGQVFPNVKFCPTGGINENTYQHYLDLNNVIAVGGSWMMK
jgi:2-dehydro-3-deoxyphosphogluconate aldolase / (4S)-4-hydroxy-2-oxoglutarate aldolase